MYLPSFPTGPAAARLPHLLRWSAVPAMAAWLAACDSPQPPTACATIPQQTLHVAESRTVDPCFEDPNDDEITLAAESSDPNVATATVRQGAVALRGVSPGSASVTVTATDPGMLKGTTDFEVLVPNRPPSAEGRIPPMELIPGGSARRDLSEYFIEPDGQVLAYSAVSSDVAVASPSLNNVNLTVVGGTEGAAMITVTATDPGGLEATQQMVVTVVEPVRLFRDDFDSEESLDDWAFTDTRREVVDGKLRLTTTNPNSDGRARTPLSATQWSVTAVMGNETDDSWAQLMLFTRDSRYAGYVLQIGADTVGSWDDVTGESGTNYRLLVWDAQEGRWLSPPGTAGTSDAVKGLGNLMKVTFSAQSGEFIATVDGVQLFRVPHDPYPDEILILSLGVSPLQGTTGKAGLFDWVEVFGLRP